MYFEIRLVEVIYEHSGLQGEILPLQTRRTRGISRPGGIFLPTRAVGGFGKGTKKHGGLADEWDLRTVVIPHVNTNSFLPQKCPPVGSIPVDERFTQQPKDEFSNMDASRIQHARGRSLRPSEPPKSIRIVGKLLELCLEQLSLCRLHAWKSSKPQFVRFRSIYIYIYVWISI